MSKFKTVYAKVDTDFGQFWRQVLLRQRPEIGWIVKLDGMSVKIHTIEITENNDSYTIYCSPVGVVTEKNFAGWLTAEQWNNPAA